MLSQGQTARKQISLSPHKILSVNTIADDVFTLEVERQFAFQPGQVVAVGLSADDSEPRLYSIASGNKNPNLRILFDVNPSGKLTPAMAKMAHGDTLYISNPFGKFIGSDQAAWWIATGTGIAPFISMAESGLFANKTLLHGARTLDKFYFSELFDALMPNNYMRFCTTEQSERVINGRLTAYLRSQPSLNPDIMYYLCGSSQMVIDVREIIVEQKSVPLENVVAEIYF